MTAPEGDRDIVKRLRDLLSRATPGPWETRRNHADCPTVGPVGSAGLIMPRAAKFADAALIAGSVTALPALLDELESLRSRTARLEEALGNLHAMVWGECPSLLNEDSGGSAHLDMEIRSLLSPDGGEGKD